MKAALPTNNTTTVLSLACLGLLAIAALQLTFPAQRQGITVVAEAAAALPALQVPPAYVPASFASYTAILERPLLYADRRLPDPPPVVAVAEIPREPLRLRLEGVALGGGSRIALLRDQSNNSLIHLAEGMTHNGWTLDSIASDTAVFTRDNESTELTLEVQPGRQR
jgi:hypothetical protein